MEIDELERKFVKLLKKWNMMVIVAEDIREAIDELAQEIQKMKTKLKKVERGDKDASQTCNRSS